MIAAGDRLDLGGVNICAVWRQLGGPQPDRQGRAPAFYRDGSTPRSVSLDPERSVWFDYGTRGGGGVLDLVATVLGGDRRAAWRWLIGTFGGSVTATPPGPPPARDRDDRDKALGAVRLWSEAVPIPGTTAARYLSSRGLDPGGDLSHALRFHPRCPFGPGERRPAMVALMRDVVTDEPCGIHRTALTPAGKKVARKMLGRARNAAVKLTPDADVTMGLGVAEGIETALGVMQSVSMPVWALLSAGGIERLPVLDIEALTVWADHDDAGLSAARACAARWKAAGIEVIIRRPEAEGSDYGDAAPLKVSR